MRSYHVRGLLMNPRILAFIVIWQLILRGYNHVVLAEEDLILMYCIMHRYKINWINVLKDHMIKTRKLANYHIPYVVLLSKIIEHFEVDLEDELVEIVKPLYIKFDSRRSMMNTAFVEKMKMKFNSKTMKEKVQQSKEMRLDQLLLLLLLMHAILMLQLLEILLSFLMHLQWAEVSLYQGLSKWFLVGSIQLVKIKGVTMSFVQPGSST